jgi:hypothetical protein
MRASDRLIFDSFFLLCWLQGDAETTDSHRSFSTPLVELEFLLSELDQNKFVMAWRTIHHDGRPDCHRLCAKRHQDPS